LVGIPGGKRPLEQSNSKRKDNIKMNLREIGMEGVKWNYLALVNTVINLWVP
jgi:hypothetical protein